MGEQKEGNGEEEEEVEEEEEAEERGPREEAVTCDLLDAFREDCAEVDVLASPLFACGVGFGAHGRFGRANYSCCSGRRYFSLCVGDTGVIVCLYLLHNSCDSDKAPLHCDLA